MNNTNENLRVILRSTVPGDFETLFLHQLDEGYAHMAAFVNEKWNDRDAYLVKWNMLLTDGKVNIRTIVIDDKIAGSVFTWKMGDELQISYGVDKEYWGRGVATKALRQFLALVADRPLYGRIAFDNTGSAKVLEKCGFKKTGEETSYAFARKKEIVEMIYLLEG